MDQILEHLRGVSGYNSRGEEIPDPKPAALQVDIEAEMPLEQKIFRAVQSVEWNRLMQKRGLETFEEANDFDVPDELPEFRSMHEDEAGDVAAFEEGRRSGFIEEIPEDRKEAARETLKKAKEMRTAADGTRRRFKYGERDDNKGAAGGINGSGSPGTGGQK